VSTTLFDFVLSNAASMTRDRILRDRQLGGQDPNEETLTQNLASEVRAGVAAGGLPIAVQEIDRNSESHLYGADLAFWIRGASGRLVGLHLQAKRQFADDTYRKLNYKPQRADRSQIEQLLLGAQRSGAGAGYIFYNGLNERQPGGTACCLEDLSPGRNGVTLAVADDVKRRITTSQNTKRVALEDICTPLCCLARCVGETPAWTEDDPAAAMRSWYSTQGGRPQMQAVEVDDAPPYLRGLLVRLNIVSDADLGANRDGERPVARTRQPGRPRPVQVTLLDAAPQL
jgi:hypothetical protein